VLSSAGYAGDPDEHSVYLLVLNMLRWERRNRATEASMEELFALLRPFLENRVGRVPFPANVSQARAAVQTPFETLKISTIEMCSLGCHRFQENTQVSSCPTCNTPRRLEDGSKTTCTFHKYALKDRLRQLFARPYQVPLLTSHANKVPDHDNMRGVHGTCQPQSMFCEVFFCMGCIR
jgi:hypothetical protein